MIRPLPWLMLLLSFAATAVPIPTTGPDYSQVFQPKMEVIVPPTPNYNATATISWAPVVSVSGIPAAWYSVSVGTNGTAKMGTITTTNTQVSIAVVLTNGYSAVVAAWDAQSNQIFMGESDPVIVQPMAPPFIHFSSPTLQGSSDLKTWVNLPTNDFIISQPVQFVRGVGSTNPITWYRHY